ncbi:MAG: sporulation protein YjcZ [Nitrososphaeraceae archaeon]
MSRFKKYGAGFVLIIVIVILLVLIGEGFGWV